MLGGGDNCKEGGRTRLEWGYETEGPAFSDEAAFVRGGGEGDGVG